MRVAGTAVKTPCVLETGGESGFLLFATAKVMSLAATRRRYSSKKQGDTPCRLAYEKNAEGYGLTRGNNEVVLEHYLTDPSEATHPHASPLRAKTR